jgi:N-dimethylarginine dimethylaminohydrolase
VKSNILPERELELDAIQFVIDQINPKNVVRPDEVHIEGGDVMLWNDYIFIGTYKGSDYKDYITARTNLEGVQFIKDLFLTKLLRNLI